MKKCTFGVYCREHDYIHGGEAEELRARLVELNDPRVNAILDDVDARDACAWLAIQKAAAQETT